MALLRKKKVVKKTQAVTVSEAVVSLPDVFKDSEFTKPADRLLEAIRQYYEKIEGRNVEKSEQLEIANKILENRK